MPFAKWAKNSGYFADILSNIVTKSEISYWIEHIEHVCWSRLYNESVPLYPIRWLFTCKSVPAIDTDNERSKGIANDKYLYYQDNLCSRLIDGDRTDLQIAENLAIRKRPNSRSLSDVELTKTNYNLAFGSFN